MMKKYLLFFISLFLALPVFAGATVLFPSGGGTGTSTAPTYGKVLVGNHSGTYDVVATSSLGISGGGSSTGSSGIVNYADGAGGWLNDAGNFSYAPSIHTLSLNKLFAQTATIQGDLNLMQFPFVHQSGTVLFTSSNGTVGTIKGDGDNFNYDSTNARLGLGTTTPSLRLDVVAPNTSASDPSAFSASLVPESLLSPGTDTVSLIYGPRDNGVDNGSVENAGYSGYTNNDQVQATVWSYRTVGGTNYISPTGINLGPIVLGNNPSGIDWNWTSETNGDGSAVDGYLILVNDQTLSTNNYFDVGNSLTYADMNATGMFPNPYNLFNANAFASSGQSFAFDLYAAPLSPSGLPYYNDNGNGFNITINDAQNNGSYFWIQHTIASTAGEPFQEIQQSNSFGYQGTGDQTFYQIGDYASSGATTPNHYGIQSDGMTLNRDYTLYTFDSVNTLYSSGDLTASIVDPNDSNYYSITYTYTTPTGKAKILENINSAGFNFGKQETVSPFYQDALGGAINSDTTITPTSVTSSAGIFENRATNADRKSQLLINSTAGSGDYEALEFTNNGTTRATFSWNNGLTLDAQSSMAFLLGGSTKAGFDGQSFRIFGNTSFNITDSGAVPWFYANQSNKTIGINKNTLASAELHIGAGTASAGTAPLKIDAGSLLTTAENGALEHNTNFWFGTDNSTRRTFMQSAATTSLTNNTYPVIDSGDHLIDGTITTSSMAFSSSTPWARFAFNPIAGTYANRFVIGSSTKTDFIDTNAGFIGFGTSTPSVPFSVANTAYFVGNVGIGIASPSEILHLFKSSGNFTTVRYDSGTTQGYFYAYDGDNSVNVGANSNSQLNFKVNNSTKALIDTSGNFAIGTSTPYALLSIQSNSSTGDAFVVATSSTNAIGGYDNDGHQFSSGPAPAISTCGTGTGTVVGDDQSGTITTATAATSCTMTFSKAYRKTPTCTVTDNSLVGFADVSSISTTAVSFGISSALTGGNLYYSCEYHK